jgi:arylsulfatase
MNRMLAGCAVLFAIAGCSRTPHPNVLWIVVDTLRADALHAYGHPEPTTPVLDALAADGVRFEQHMANASQTVPSTLTMLLSRPPVDHGFSPPDPAVFARQRPVYPQELLFFAEVLRDAGYTTNGQTANPYLAKPNGFDQGFDAFGTSAGRGEELVAAATRWLGDWAKERSRPFHVYLHLMDVHQPYDPPAEYLARFAPTEGRVRMEGNRAVPFADPRDLAYNAARYAACVAYVDALIGRLLGELDSLGVRGDTLVVVTADHGEEFGEHGGIGHGRHVYGEVVRVPLILSWPGHLEPRVVAHPSQHLDLAPTVLALAGVARPDAYQGGSVLEPVDAVLLEIGPWRGIVAGRDKLVWQTVTGERRLFALDDALDRAPRDDAATSERLAGRLAALEAARPQSVAEPAAAKPDAWSDEEKERLRALGYAQ